MCNTSSSNRLSSPSSDTWYCVDVQSSRLPKHPFPIHCKSFSAPKRSSEKICTPIASHVIQGLTVKPDDLRRVIEARNVLVGWGLYSEHSIVAIVINY